MTVFDALAERRFASVVLATGESPAFGVGERVKIASRMPLGHYRVPIYLRGRSGVIEAVIDPRAIDNEQEGFGLNAGPKGTYYRVAFALSVLWPGYKGSPRDSLRIEVFESWLERAPS
jgi:nitrile hydratase